MKHILSIMTVAAMLLVAAPSQAKVKLGLRGGINVSNVKVSSTDSYVMVEKGNHGGFYIGPTLKCTLPLAGLGVDVAGLYDYRSVNINGDSFRYQALSVPINLRYTIGLGSKLNVFGFAGPQFGFNLNSSCDEWRWKSSDLSANAGLGITVLDKVEVRANYNFACSRSGRYFGYDIIKKQDVAARFNTWQIGLAYWF